MLRSFILLGCFIVFLLGITVIEFPDGLAAVGMVSILAVAIVFAIRRFADDSDFLISVFLAALVLRMGLGIIIHAFELREFFGPDAIAYDIDARHLLDVWMGRADLGGNLLFQTQERSASFWGIYVLTAGIYYILGPNLFAAQSFVAVVGAATAPMVFLCSKAIFANAKVARFTAISIAVFPSFIVWSSQLLKDGLVIFLLVTVMVTVLELQRKFSYASMAILVFSLMGILSVRFYVFYMAVVAVGGSFLVGLSRSNVSILRNALVIIVLGFALIYFGVDRRALQEFEVFGNLERVQIGRLDLARSAESGFDTSADVSTTEGAISTIPRGFIYLMFAPFPWEATNLRQAITIPEVLIWWAALPFFIIGLIYTLRHRLRSAFPILIFSVLLTLTYSISQGNVGTAYRQRTQIQVFMFIIIGAGVTVYKEKKENERIIRQAAQRRVDEALRAGAMAIGKR
jgi:hypothetical protein